MNTSEENLVQIPAGRIEMLRDQARIDSYLFGVDALTGLLNKSLDEFRSFGYGELTMPEIMELVWSNKKEESLVRDRATDGKPVKIGGLFFSADKVREMVDIPNLSAFEFSVAALKKGAKELKEKNQIRLNHFEIVNGIAEISETEKQIALDQRCQFAETENEKEVFLIMQGIIDNLRYLQTAYNFHALDFKPLPLVEQSRGMHTFPATTKMNVHLIKSFFEVKPAHWR